MMHHPGASDEMHEEWIAWRMVCGELEKCACAIDINVEPNLHNALVLWGERLAALRRTQDPEDCADWLEHASMKYSAVPVTK
jgi:hypothetical protein